jgi:hypothetical protein
MFGQSFFIYLFFTRKKTPQKLKMSVSPPASPPAFVLLPQKKIEDAPAPPHIGYQSETVFTLQLEEVKAPASLINFHDIKTQLSDIKVSNFLKLKKKSDVIALCAATVVQESVTFSDPDKVNLDERAKLDQFVKKLFKKSDFYELIGCKRSKVIFVADPTLFGFMYIDGSGSCKEWMVIQDKYHAISFGERRMSIESSDALLLFGLCLFATLTNSCRKDCVRYLSRVIMTTSPAGAKETETAIAYWSTVLNPADFSTKRQRIDVLPTSAHAVLGLPVDEEDTNVVSRRNLSEIISESLSVLKDEEVHAVAKFFAVFSKKI